MSKGGGKEGGIVEGGVRWEEKVWEYRGAVKGDSPGDICESAGYSRGAVDGSRWSNLAGFSEWGSQDGGRKYELGGG